MWVSPGTGEIVENQLLWGLVKDKVHFWQVCSSRPILSQKSVAPTSSQHSYEMGCCYVLARDLFTSSSASLPNNWFSETHLHFEVAFLWSPPLSCNIKCLSLGTLAVNTVVHVHVVLLLFVCTLTILAKQQANPWKVGATCFSFFIPVIQCSIWHMADIHLVFLDTAPKEVWLFFPVANEETVLWVPESGLKFRPGWFQNPCSFYYAMPFLNETMLN